MRKNLPLILTSLALFLLLAGCDSISSTDPATERRAVTPETGRITPHRLQSAQPFQTLDDRLAEVADRVPGFGGLFFDEDGRLHVYQLDPSLSSRTTAALDLLTDLDPATRADARVLEATYDFRQLQEWRLLVRQNLLGHDGVMSLDIDERVNRLTVGIEDAAHREQTRAALEALGIPEEAVLVVETSPFTPLQAIPPGWQGNTLVEEVDPKAGGLQIERSAGGACTLGFNATWYNQQTGQYEDAFVTNSHCTNVQGGVENTAFGQPDSPDVIGTEVQDPPYFSGTSGYYTCPVGYVCRLSDSAVVRYAPGIDHVLGKIYKTRSYGTGGSMGSIIHDGNMFTITSTGTYPYAGQTLNKIGRTTGWTRGPVSNTCIDISQYGTSIILLCQGIVDARSDGGDSGSPVFRQLSENEVRLEGILWGENPNAHQFAFSPIASVTQELDIYYVY
ncbi:MAG: hypothetical protein D6685_00560 [Bacteroidetes bacterium]|nr:hypothetical protein AWN76_013015 [Rhodothermaceae bacterium RA]RMH70011.1 MAG: hypothetical protein D6685_00560 [Bacteroidota bacterium]